MTREPGKGHAALLRGRWSQSGADYFITICTEGKRAGLTGSGIAEGIQQEMHVMVADGTWSVRSATIMPDHAHFLITLGARLSLGRAVQRLKAKASASLRVEALPWERGLYDHHMRPDDDALAIFLYLYLNPYRAGLIAKDAKWPHYYCCESDWQWLSPFLDQDIPPPEWLQR
jgi:REP element-mobilizing transposase RayT